MIDTPLSHDPFHAHGWAEILLRRDHLPVPTGLMDLSSDEYTQAGSNLPLEEFPTPLDIYRHILQPPPPGYGIPRRVRAFDALNFYEDRLNLVVTFILIPKKHCTAYDSPETCILEERGLSLALASRPEPFNPFALGKQ